MGGSHKARNIPFELSNYYEDLIAEGLTRNEAINRLFEDATHKLEAQTKEIQKSHKAVGASMLREYTRYFQKYGSHAEGPAQDDFRKAAIKLRLQLIGHTISDRSRNVLLRPLSLELEQLDPAKSAEFLDELIDSIDTFPTTASGGHDVSYRYAGLKEFIDSFSPPAKTPTDQSRLI